MKKWILTPVIALLVTLSSACVIVTEDPPDASLTIVNESSYAIYELYVSEVERSDYGRNLLGAGPLLPGEEILIDVYCDYYDVLLIDQDGYECELLALDLCYQDTVWVIDNAELASCSW